MQCIGKTYIFALYIISKLFNPKKGPRFMKCKKLFPLLTSVVMLASCDKSTPHINVICEENSVGNSIVKWESMSGNQGHVKAYASTDPRHIPEDTPVAMADMADSRMTIINPDPTRRYYYTLVFNERHRIKVANRNVIIPGLQNFRDLGGYTSYPGRKQVRWGMIYRSAAIDSLPSWSLSELKNLGIKTVIDLRNDDEKRNPTLLNPHFNVVSIPIHIGCTRQLLQQIERQQVDNETVCKTLQQMYTDIITECSPQFKQIFTLLQDEANYPVLMHCTTGKGRLGVISALILSALHVDSGTIMSDYQLSNNYFDIRNASKVAHNLPSASQEAITSLYSARVNYLNASLKAIEKQFGNTNAYLQKEVGLKKEEIKKLQSILLETVH